MRKFVLLLFLCGFGLLLAAVIYADVMYQAPASVTEPTQAPMLEAAQTLPPETTVPETTLPPETTAPTEALEGAEADFMAVKETIAYNSELQGYFPEQVAFDGDTIRLTADRVDGEYRSGKVVSRQAYRYGSFSFRITTLTKGGLFPAIWMLPASKERLPEVDIYEMIGSEPYRIYGVLHYINDYDQQTKKFFATSISEKKVTEPYVLRFEWTEEKMDWYTDDRLIGTLSGNVPNEPMYLILNLAIGGSWAGTPLDAVFPAEFECEILELDPIEVYER